MNVYFLVEGKRCERKLYPMWLSYVAPHLNPISKPADATENSYFLISGEGYPSIIDVHLPNAIRDVESIKKFDVLVVVLDANNRSIQERINQVTTAANKAEVLLQSAKLEVLVQNRCIETWLLGNRKIFVRQPQSTELRDYIQHYDVQQHDPEQMPKHADFNSHGQFHLAYLKGIFRERNLSYTKTRPGHAGTQTYFEQLAKRIENSPDHIQSFAYFLRLCESF